jgi:hypothetical protein
VLTEAFFQCREQCPNPTSSRCNTALILAANSDSHWNRPWWWTSGFLFLFFPKISLLLPQLPYCIDLALVHGFTHFSTFSGQWCKEFPCLWLAGTHPCPNLAPRLERTGRGSKAKQIIQLIHRQLRREIRRCSKTLKVKVVPQLLPDKFIHTVVLVADLTSYGICAFGTSIRRYSPINHPPPRGRGGIGGYTPSEIPGSATQKNSF